MIQPPSGGPGQAKPIGWHCPMGSQARPGMSWHLGWPGSHGVQGSPHVFCAQGIHGGIFGHRRPMAGTQAFMASHAIGSMGGGQLWSPGAQGLHGAPQSLEAQGS